MKLLLRIKQFFEERKNVQKGLFFSIGFLCITPFVSAPLALILGLFIAFFVGSPFQEKTQKSTHYLLQISVVGLGFGMNVNAALKAGKEGFIFTIVSIISVFVLGFLLSKLLKIENVISYLISAGTAICGGSAIAAVSPIIRAKASEISVALACVFILNSIALLLFPYIGNVLHLSQHQFGLWSAIAIHDTSSVVGAASKFGNEALEVATTVKLTRALWIIPLSFVTVFLFNNKEAKPETPWFIAFFVMAMCLNTYVPFVHNFSSYFVLIAKAGLTLTLFFIGSNLSLETIKNIGIKPLFFAVILWTFISCASLLVILFS